jgi:hypothetical protein
MPIITPKFRVSFPHLFKPQYNKLSKKDEYSVMALFPKGTDLSAMEKAAHDACVKKWGPNEKAWPKKVRMPFRDQGEKEFENDAGKMVLPAGHEKGAIFMNFKSKERPGVVGPDVQPILDASEVYPGCYARAAVTAYAYEAAGNFGVAFGLTNLQKMGDGDRFGTRTKAEDDFTAISNEVGKTAGDMFT